MNLWWSIIGYSALGCVGMAVLDSCGTVMVRAIAAGKGVLAGAMDAAADLAKITILSISGVELTHAYGWRGWFGVVPILVTGFLVTMHATHLTHGIENEETAQEDDDRDTKIRWLEREFQILKAHHEANQ
jgi:hypothetical protein